MQIAVVTGRHVFEVIPLHHMLREVGREAGFDFYVQHMEDFAADLGHSRQAYDAILFFHMLEKTPIGDEPWPHQHIRAAIESLGQTTQGIVLLHHSLVAWPDWDIWSRLVGIPHRKGNKVGFSDVQIQVADPSHPISHGLTDWVMHDETYKIQEPGADCQVLLQTPTPTSMRALAWTHQVDQSRVVCLQNGHGPIAWNNPAWRRLLTNSLLWSARRP